ncbi:MAG: hypothetical protein HYY26_01415 [Acidobacteria bacterium]|nr:hypothetical protein [Acidobacteriota bacterium]
MAAPHRASLINLPHAHTIVGRLVRWFEGQPEQEPFEQSELRGLLSKLDRCLRPYPEDPPDNVALAVADEVAQVARAVVEEIERTPYRGDRLGQCVRNLFECLGLSAEGGELSLRCGERPDSPLR